MMRMFVCLSLLVSLLALPLFANPDPAADPVGCSSTGNLFLPYRLFDPGTGSAANRIPLIVFHHGKGEIGTDNKKQIERHIFGLIAKTQGTASNPPEYPAVLVAPQLPTEFLKAAQLDQLIERLCQDYPIDRSRIYITGLSLGGRSIWISLGGSPNIYAAAVPLSAVAHHSAAPDIAAGQIPIWAFHGENDGIVFVGQTTGMVNAINAANGFPPRYTLRPNWGHSNWNNIYSETPGWTNFWIGSDPSITDEQLYSWLFSQKKSAARTLIPGDKIMIDFGNGAGLISRNNDPSNFWNCALRDLNGSTHSPALPAEMRTASGKRTSISLEQNAAFTGSGSGSDTTGAQDIANAARDFWLIGSSASHEAALALSGEITLRGLIPHSRYRLRCHGNRRNSNTGQSHLTRYTVGTQSRDLETINNPTNQAVFDEVIAESDGSLTISVGVSPLNTTVKFAFLNVIELQALASPAGSYSTWAVNNLPEDHDHGLLANPDQDTGVNLIEYLLGTLPGEASVIQTNSPAPGNFMAMISSSATEGLLTVQGSNTLTNWQNLATYDFATDTAVGLAVTTQNGEKSLSYSATAQSQTVYQFYRLSGTLPQP